LADVEHHVARITTSPGFAPKLKLLGKIGRGLSGKRGVGRSDAFPPLAVTPFACQDAAGTVAFMVELRSGGWHVAFRLEGQLGIIKRHRAAFTCFKLLRYPAHLRMIPAAIGICFKLPFQISRIQACQSRRSCAVAASVKAVTGKTGIIGAGLRAAHRDDVSIFGKTIQRRGLSRGAVCEHHYCREWNHDTHFDTTGRLARLFRFMALASMLMPIAACKPPPDDRQSMPMASTANGKQVIEQVGCGSCHVIPGVDWPKGEVGPALAGLAGRALIAGKLPNRPDMLAAYIRNAPAFVPGSGMPAMPLTEAEARDIAAYLYQHGER
jgi:mono/diheme cytochrome c family protein